MSKTKQRKPRPVRVSCSHCRAKLPATPAALLQQAAEALNACRKAGLDLKVRRGRHRMRRGPPAAPVGRDGRGRTRLYTEFPPEPEQGDRLD